MSIPRSDLPRIVILGCGFAGLQLIKKIKSKHYQVVLLDQNNYHTFQPLMYQVATCGLEPDSIAYPIRKVFRNKKRFHFRMAEVQSVDPKKQTVYSNAGNFDYDYCVFATGADSNFFGIKSIQDNAVPMKSLVESLNLRSKILENFEAAEKATTQKERELLMNIVIVGAGPTGVELAGAIAELKNKILPKDYHDLDLSTMNIYLLEAADQVLAPMSDKASKNAERFLKKLGVNIWLKTMVKEYDGEKVITNQEAFNSNTLIWTAGVAAIVPEIKDYTIPTKNKRLPVDQKGKVQGFEKIYALGDAAHFEEANEGIGYPMLASVAMQQGVFLGKNFNRLGKGKDLKQFKYKDKGTMATIGRNKAVADLAQMHFKGFFAWVIWMLVHLMLLVGFRNRVVVFINWTWNYLKFNNEHRLIVRKYTKE